MSQTDVICHLCGRRFQVPTADVPPQGLLWGMAEIPDRDGARVLTCNFDDQRKDLWHPPSQFSDSFEAGGFFDPKYRGGVSLN